MATKSEIERLSVVETKMDAAIERLDRIDAKLDNLDKKFSAKWVEWVIKGLIAFILIWFLGSLTHLIEKSPVQVVKEVTSSTTTSSNSPSSPTQTTPSTPSNSSNPSSNPVQGVLDGLPKVQMDN